MSARFAVCFGFVALCSVLVPPRLCLYVLFIHFVYTMMSGLPIVEDGEAVSGSVAKIWPFDSTIGK